MTATIFQQGTLTDPAADWAQSLTFNQFDPATGDLRDAVFTLSGTIAGSLSIENLAPVAATVSIGLGASIHATAPGLGEVGSVYATAGASVALAPLQGAFDGRIDFGGPSGTTIANIVGTQTQSARFDTGPDGVWPLLGTGTFDVGVTSQANSTVVGNGNLAVELHGSTSAVLSLQYHATTPGGGGGDNAGGVDMAVFPGLFGWIDNEVTTTPQVVTLAPQTSGWTGAAGFNQFDPALGTLIEIVLNVGNTIGGTFGAENLEAVPVWIGMTEAASMTLSLPGGTVAATANAADWFSLPGFDGSVDVSGTSGRFDEIADSQTAQDDINSHTVFPRSAAPTSAELMSAADLAAFTGTGTIDLPVSTAGTSTVTGPANLLEEITQRTGGTVSVSYVYTPAALTASAAPKAGDSGFWSAHSPHPWSDDMPGPSSWHIAAVLPALMSDTPGPRFLGGLLGGTDFTAKADQTFVIEPVARETINNFSIAANNRLDLTAVLSGMPLAHDLSNLGSFLNISDQSWDGVSGVNTTLAVSGPNGVTSVVLGSSGSVDLPGLLGARSLVLPSH